MTDTSFALSLPRSIDRELAYIFDVDDDLPIDEDLSAALEPIDD